MKPGWYWHRLTRMSPAEIGGRVSSMVRQGYWSVPERRPTGLDRLSAARPRHASVRLKRVGDIESPAVARVIATADLVLAGIWPVFAVARRDVPAEPDWFLDPLSGIRSPHHGYAFRIPHRNEAIVGNVKHVWEPSRHQTTTLLACAWWLTGNPAYAERAASHLTSWWRDNPFLEGIHWTSGIEVGLRLISWAWIRSLLADWPGCRGLFDDNDAFAVQLYQHQRYLAAFRSIGSSANNHLIAELAGLAVASAAFPWFKESGDWADWASRQLAQESDRQTHLDGFNREQASDYHIFVLEILLSAALLTRLAGQAPLPGLLDVVRRMADALAASLDQTGRPPRFGDGDDGRGLLLDAPDADPSVGVLGAARIMFGGTAWWPERSRHISVLAIITGQICGAAKPDRVIPRQDLFDGSGQAILRTGQAVDEVWVRCDHGPLGYRSIAAHGHADALSVELRCGGVEILADPGTYCYHGETEWRTYFKGTAGHNTLAVEGLDQASYGGPFLWLTRPDCHLEHCNLGQDLVVQEWQARHDGYCRLKEPVIHYRHVTLDVRQRTVTITDWIESISPRTVALAYHFGPDVHAELGHSGLLLSWTTPLGPRQGYFHLPGGLQWRLHRGETDPPLGWYSSHFGHKAPAFTAVGRGLMAPRERLESRIDLPNATGHLLFNRNQTWPHVQLVS